MQSFDEIKKKSLSFSTEAQKTIEHLADEFSRGVTRMAVNISLNDGQLCIWAREPNHRRCFNGVEALRVQTMETSVKKWHDQLLGELKEITEGCNFKITDVIESDDGSYILIERQ